MIRALRLAGLFSLIVSLLIACGDGDESSSADTVDTADTAPHVAGDAADDAADATPEAEVQEPEPPGLVRFVHVSDIHFGGTVDDPRPEWWQGRISKLNAVTPAADLLISTGDQVDAMISDIDEDPSSSPLTVVKEALDGLDMPWECTIGNHEYYAVFEGAPTLVSDPDAREATFSTAMERPIYYDVIVNGVRFVMMNSMDGKSWDDNVGLLGSFSAAQLLWLDDLLADGVPSLLFFHHPPSSLEADPGAPSLCEVMEGHPGVVKGLFTGHFHSFLKGEACAAPSFIVGNLRDDEASFFVVEYDGQADTLTVVNEDELPFAEPPEYECEPGQEPAIDPDAAVGLVQRFVVDETSTDATGLGAYVGDALQSIPFLLSLDAASPDRLDARLTIATRWGEPEDYFAYVDGSPCPRFDLRLDAPCFSAGPVAFEVDLGLFLGALIEGELDPSWRLRLMLEDLRIEGRLEETDGVPLIAEGAIQARIAGATAIADLKMIVIGDYCAGEIEACEPGSSEELPACPADPGPEFFDEIPANCDLEVEGFTIRTILGLVGGLPETITAMGSLRSELVESNAEPTPGFYDPDLFSVDDGMNCAP